MDFTSGLLVGKDHLSADGCQRSITSIFKLGGLISGGILYPKDRKPLGELIQPGISHAAPACFWKAQKNAFQNGFEETHRPIGKKSRCGGCLLGRAIWEFVEVLLFLCPEFPK